MTPSLAHTGANTCGQFVPQGFGTSCPTVKPMNANIAVKKIIAIITHVRIDFTASATDSIELNPYSVNESRSVSRVVYPRFMEAKVL
jgi:hypothetical protein